MTTRPVRRRRRRKQALVLALALAGLPLQGCAQLMMISQLFSGLASLITGGASIFGAVQKLGGPTTQKPPSTSQRPVLSGTKGPTQLDTRTGARPVSTAPNRGDLVSIVKRSTSSPGSNDSLLGTSR